MFRVRDNLLMSVLPWLLLSVMIHAGAAIYASARHTPDAAGRAPEYQANQSTPPDEVRPGIESSNAMVISWIGFEEPTPHSAAPSDYDQPALSRNTGAPPATPMLESPVPIPTPEPITHAAQAQQTQEIQHAMHLLGAHAEQGARWFEHAGADVRQAAQASIQPLRQLLARLTPPTPTTTRSAQAEPSEPVPATTPAQRTQSPSASGVGDAGTPSDRESAPVSIANVPIEMRELGNPLAAAGLDIKTVRPRFTHYTRLTARPADPLIRVEFNHAGQVVKAELLESSGHRDVDNPILDAVYRWSASGKPLETLKGRDSAATIPIEFRIVL